MNAIIISSQHHSHKELWSLEKYTWLFSKKYRPLFFFFNSNPRRNWVVKLVYCKSIIKYWFKFIKNECKSWGDSCPVLKGILLAVLEWDERILILLSKAIIIDIMNVNLFGNNSTSRGMENNMLHNMYVCILMETKDNKYLILIQFSWKIFL